MKQFIIAVLAVTVVLAVYQIGRYVLIPTERQQRIELINYTKALEI